MRRWLINLVFGFVLGFGSLPFAKAELLFEADEKAGQGLLRSSEDRGDMKKIMVSPLMLLVGVLHLEASLPLANSWALEPRGFYFNAGDSFFNVAFSGVGLYGRYHFGRSVNEHSWYVGFGADAVRVQAAFFGIPASTVGVVPGVMVGYQWAWNSMVARLGAGYSIITPLFDFTIGVLF